MPQPGSGRVRNPSGQYAYTNGDILGGAGFLRLRVAPEGVRAEFVRTSQGVEVAHTYALAPRPGNSSQSATTTPGSRVVPAPVDSGEPPQRKGGRKGGKKLGQEPPPARKERP